MMSKGALAERRHDAFRHGGADPSHLTGGEILLDAFNPRRCGRSQNFRLELKSVNPVADPSAASRDPLTGPDDGRMRMTVT
jgi:hypothetical protein